MLAAWLLRLLKLVNSKATEVVTKLGGVSGPDCHKKLELWLLYSRSNSSSRDYKLTQSYNYSQSWKKCDGIEGIETVSKGIEDMQGMKLEDAVGVLSRSPSLAQGTHVSFMCMVAAVGS